MLLPLSYKPLGIGLGVEPKQKGHEPCVLPLHYPIEKGGGQGGNRTRMGELTAL